jgi:predicted PurR-regulated permease PerM
MTTLIIVTALSVLAVIVVIGLAALKLLKLNQQQSQTINSLQNQLSALTSGAVGLDQRIHRFEQALSKIKEHQNTLDLGLTSSHNYEQAIRLARKGVEMNQLIDNCNLSDEEAHLINRLHGLASDAQAELH